MTHENSVVDFRPRRRGKSAKSLALVNASHVILEEIQPATVRAVCYRLFVAGLVPDMTKASTNKVSSHLVWARENGVIPWAWIVDETRSAEGIATWKDPAAILAAAVLQYRRDYWQEQSFWIEVWSEKGTVRGTLAPVLDEFGVTFRVMHGYGSATAINDVAEMSMTQGRTLRVLYVGDWDCSGMHISEVDLPGRLARYGGLVDIERIALTEAHIGPGLPSFPADDKRNDPRFTWYRSRYGGRCWELDALSPVILRTCVRDAICTHIDFDAWEAARLAERAERESLEAYLAGMPSNLRQAPKYPREPS